MEKQFPIPNRNYKVLCRCYTYNQASYIEDSLNGFVMQQTEFPFVCLVVDDCSTDGEQEVIKAFLNRECDMESAEYYEDDTTKVIYVKHKTNINCYLAVYLLKENLYKQKKRKMAYVTPWRNVCEYEALCEGDDYWTNPMKLQKQAAFMDSYDDSSFCCTANYRKTPEGTDTENHYKDSNDFDCSIEDYILSKGDTIDTCTMMMRLSLMTNYPDWYYKVGVGDIPTKLILFERGKVGYINDITACYRLSASSSWTRRMASSTSMRWKNHKRIITMWNDFDEWSGRKHHKAISTRKRKLNLHFIKGELGYIYRRIFKKE